MQQVHMGKSLKNDQWISNEESPDPTVGRVLAVGNLAYKDIDKFPTGKWCDVGDYVCYGKHSGQKLYYKSTRLILLFDDQIMLKVEDPKDLDPTFNLTRGSN